ncbi:Response regulator of zinc sigma-54-dependent two-component system [Labilithrix luteola]|uniref:Response regulator of zinc sigma-54-dependent two-component system n=1 Tax=Labilithrix luteola TaxID=1391654 RepID=A0A0K1PYG9_9BACT|nr:sigma 54-interacting transcriptional regulator [Labilithrix luteola]AKU98547.1 Response regulator of zinc sigma-54-dependent two-component system [Labilithrix luteola]
MKDMAGLDATLGRVSLRMASTLELDGVLDEITRGLGRDLDAALARVWLVRKGEPRYLELVASAGLSERLDGSHSRVPVGELKIGAIAATRAPVCSNDLLGDPRFTDKTWIRQSGLLAFGGYPLVFDKEVLGVLAMFARRPLTDAEFDRLGIFAAHASVAIKNAELFAEVTDLSQRLEAENTYLKEELHEGRPSGIVGQSTMLTRALGELERVARTDSTVLLGGETGTGKELFARALHEMSPRRGQPLVKVNCAAIAPSLIESELFGHEKGAFTGALQRRLGRFELAQGGTLLLDEIGELPLETQAKLLRVLQEHEVERVGGTQPIRLDVRIVAATNRDLAAEVRANRFRADLFFRLNVFPIRVPPLRERREDIPSLIDALVRALATRLRFEPKGVEEDAISYLQAYDWPGNVRELQNVLERASILARGNRIRLEDLPELRNAIEELLPVPTDDDTSSIPLKARVDAYERSLVADALRRAQGNQSEAARLLRTSRATLQYKMKTYRL